MTSRSEKMESLSTGGLGWQVSRVFLESKLGDEFLPLAGQNMDEWGRASVLM
jgi:hypothetical protein